MSENNHLPAEVLLYESEFVDGESVMVYEHNEGWHSAAYTKEGRHFDLVFNYTKRFNLIFEHLNEDAEILMIGGGAYSYPKYVISHYPNASISVVEIDPTAVDSAMSFFYLDELMEQYHPDTDHRLEFITDDGRHYMEHNTHKYDAVIFDAYDGFYPVFELLTLEAMKLMHAGIKENGIFAANLPGFVDLQKSDFLLNVLYTAQQVFRHVLLVPAPTEGNDETSNYVLFASDCYDHITDMIEYDTTFSHVLYDMDTEDLWNDYIY